MKVETRAVADLREHPKNSRIHSDDQIAGIARSITRYGFNDPIAIDAAGVVLAGHGRLAAARLVGLDEVPVLVLDHLSPEEARAYLIAHNKLSDQAGWDKDMVEAEFRELVDFGIESDVFGLTEEERNILLAPDRRDVGNTEADAIPEKVLTRAKVGDVWKLGRHSLVVGDSTKPETLKTAVETVGAALADVMVTDPPYNVDYTGKTGESLKIDNDSMDDDEFRAFLGQAMAAAADVTKAGGCFHVFHSSSKGRIFEDAINAAGWMVKQTLIWMKDRAVMGRQDFNWQHEPIFYGWKEGAAHYFCRDFTLTTKLDFTKPSANREHPTMKPVDLVQHLMECSSRPGEVVLEPFGGSGSTVIAAEKSGRTCACVELEPRYADVILTRYEEFTGIAPEKVK